MSDFFKTNPDVAVSEDRMPSTGGNFDPLDTGLYKMKIEKIYLEESNAGAKCCKLELRRTDKTGPIIRETLWLSSRKSKGQRNTWKDSDGVKHYMGGYEILMQLQHVITGNPIDKLVLEDKLVKIRNWDTNQDEPMEREVPTELVGKAFVAAITKRVENKRAKNDEDKYVDTNERRVFNKLHKPLAPEGALTVTEMLAGATEAEWAKQFRTDFPETFVDDKFKPVEGAVDLNDDDADGDIPWSGKADDKDDDDDNIFS